MADNANTGAPDQLGAILAQFVDAKHLNARIDGMFKPLAERIQADTAKRNFTLFSLFFGKEDIADIKKHVKDNIAKITKGIKADSVLPKTQNRVNITGLNSLIERVPVGKERNSKKVQLPTPIDVITPKPTKKAKVDKIIPEISKKAKVDKTEPKVNKAKAPEIAAQPKQTTKDLIASKNALNVNLVGIDENALKTLSKVLKGREKKKTEKKAEPKPESGDLLQQLLGAALAGFTAFKLLKAAWGDNGPLKGAMETIGLALTKVATLLFKGAITSIKALIKLLPKTLTEKLPTLNVFAKIGTLLSNLGKSVSGFIENAIIKAFAGFYKLAPKLAVMFFNVAEKSTNLITKLPGILLKGLASISPVATSAVKSVAGLIGKVGGSIGKFLFKRLKLLPFIGPLISFGFGIKRIVDGDYVGGIVELLGGIIGLVPGMSFVAPFITDLFLAGRDIVTGGVEKTKNGSTNQFIGNFLKALKETTVYKWIANIGEGILDLVTGNPINGILRLANAVGGPLQWVVGLFTNTTAFPQFKVENTNPLDKIRKAIVDKIKQLFSWATGLLTKIKGFFGIGKTEKLDANVATNSSQKAVELRTKISEIKDQQKAATTATGAETDKKRRLNDLEIQRAGLEKQLDTLTEKNKKAKKEQADIDVSEPDPEPLHEETVVDTVPTVGAVDDVRQAALDASTKTNDSDKIVSAINDLKQVQTAQIEKVNMTMPEKKKDFPVSVVSSVSNNYKQTTDINVDTARDSIFILRDGMRQYLYNQRASI